MTSPTRIAPIENATNQSWGEWLVFLNGIGAQELDHHTIATRVLEALDGKIENPAWWAQEITVAYEQQIGRRLPGQRSDGTFQTSISKATRFDMQDLMDAWTAFAAEDGEVAALITAEPRVSGTDKRMYWRTKGKESPEINVLSEPKQNGTASLVVQLLGQRTPEENAAAKAAWGGIVGRFAAKLRKP